MTAQKTGVVVFAFGVGGLPNKLLADYANALATKPTIYTQADIPLPNSPRVKRIAENPGNPPPTLRIARWAVGEAIKDGVTKLIVIGARPHRSRCLRDTKYAAKEIGAEIEVLPFGLETHPLSIWYSSESTQRRTQSPWNWWRREIILHCLPMWIYKRIAN